MTCICLHPRKKNRALTVDLLPSPGDAVHTGKGYAFSAAIRAMPLPISVTASREHVFPAAVAHTPEKEKNQGLSRSCRLAHPAAL